MQLPATSRLMRFAPLYDAILNDQPRLLHPTPKARSEQTGSAGGHVGVGCVRAIAGKW